MTEAELRAFEAAAEMPGLVEISGANLGKLCAALREAWLDLGRLANDRECDSAMRAAGEAKERERWLALLAAWCEALEGRAESDRYAGHLLGALQKTIAEQRVRARNLPAPMPHDLLRLRHDRMESALRGVAAACRDRFTGYEDIGRMAAEALEEDQ